MSFFGRNSSGELTIDGFAESELRPRDTAHVIYPEDVYVPHDTILGWAHDAIVNAAMDDYVKNHGPLPDDADGDIIWESIARANPRPTDVEEAKAILSDIGTHTFARE